MKTDHCCHHPPPQKKNKKKLQILSAKALWDTVRHIRNITKELMANVGAASGKIKYFHSYNINILSLAD